LPESKLAQRFLALDSWRGICALLVAVFHFRCNNHVDGLGLVRNAYLFVDFFFVLSGFVIAHAYMDRLNSGTQVGDFVMRRFWRLWPLHVTVLMLFVASEFVKLVLVHDLGIDTLNGPFTGPHSVEAIFTNILMIHSLGVHDRLTWNIPSWSISTEFYTYLVFAVVCILAARSRARLAVLTLGALAMIALGLVIGILTRDAGPDAAAEFGFFRCLYGFFLGYLTYRWFQAFRLPSWSVSILELAALVAVLIYVSAAEKGFWPILAPVIFAVVIWIFAHDGGIVSRALRVPIGQKLGAWSYSIYMAHALVVLTAVGLVAILGRFTHYDYLVKISGFEGPSNNRIDFGNPFIGDAATIVYLIAVVILASLTYRFIERPGQRLWAWRGRVHSSLPGERPAA
jgi:peptidoglycan/LPS O-acetylase OafA/YrhL